MAARGSPFSDQFEAATRLLWQVDNSIPVWPSSALFMPKLARFRQQVWSAMQKAVIDHIALLDVRVGRARRRLPECGVE